MIKGNADRECLSCLVVAPRRPYSTFNPDDPRIISISLAIYQRIAAGRPGRQSLGTPSVRICENCIRAIGENPKGEEASLLAAALIGRLRDRYSNPQEDQAA